MPLWSMDEWQYLEREVVTDPKGRQWTVALMDVLGQVGDPDMPNKMLELQYSSGRYFTLVYSPSGAVQRERGYALLRGVLRLWRHVCHEIHNDFRSNGRYKNRQCAELRRRIHHIHRSQLPAASRRYSSTAEFRRTHNIPRQHPRSPLKNSDHSLRNSRA